MVGMLTTASSRNTPCAMVATLVRPPELMLAEVRTMTEVIGIPPIRPLSILPAPCANSSRLPLVKRFSGSSLSAASMHSSVSILATAAMVAATIHTCGFWIAAKSGRENCPIKSLKDLGTGRLTKWSCEMAREDPLALNTSLSTTPATTATSAPGTTFNFFRKATFV